MFAKTLSLYLHWHGYRLNVIKLLPHKTTKSIKQLYTVSPTRSRNTTVHRSRFLLWQPDHLSYSLPSTVMMEFSSATEHTAMKMFSARRWMGGPTFIPPPPTPPPLLPPLLVQIQRYKVEELDGWLDWHTSTSQQSLCHRKKLILYSWWRSRWSWHTGVCYCTIRKV